ncbi:MULTISPECIES: FecR family protein [Butyricimonas]|uniref:FecR family protein n=1 Tax=Butyricimonas TaxID=574697 RepID=UPI0007FB38BD|nr:MULTISPECIES: FecR domain-containing protein [Butyricimonas]
MKKFNDKEREDLEIAQKAVERVEAMKKEMLLREMVFTGEEGMEQSGTGVVERMVEDVHRVARMDRKAAAAGLQSRLREMERRKRASRRWLYVGSSVAAAVVLFFMVTMMLPEKERVMEKAPVLVNVAEIKVPTLITTGEDDAIVALDTLEVKQGNDVYVVGEESQTGTVEENEPEEKPVRNVRIVIPAGFTYSVQLADGSTVVLNAGSELRFPEEFRDSVREVEMKGEGYFNVKKSDIPFIVQAGETQVKVYGTRFNLFYRKELALSEAVLVEGSIGMMAGGKEVRIVPNERVYYTMKDSVVRTEKVDPADYIAWMENSFKYNGVRLDKIVFDISQWYGVEIRLAPELESRTCTLEFDKSSTIDWVIKALGLIIDKNIKQEGGAYYIN